MEPCNCFNEWLKRNPEYNKYPPETMQLLVRVWNAGWNEGWKRFEYQLRARSLNGKIPEQKADR